MKKIIALLLVLVMVFALAACGGTETPENTKKPSGDNSTSGKQGGNKDNKGGEQEAKAPKGYSDGNFWYIRSNVWDTEFLPKILPAPLDSYDVDSTTMKDYKHGDLSNSYTVGSLEWEEAGDYRVYGVLFECDKAQKDAYIEAVKAKGFVGGVDDHMSGTWEYSFSHADGWYLYINANEKYSNPDRVNVSISLTDSVHESPKSLGGLKLPTVGVPSVDIKNGAKYQAYDIANGYDEVELDVNWSGSFPDSGKYVWYLDLYYTGVSSEAVTAYCHALEADGWSVYYDDEPEEDYFNNFISKGDIDLEVIYSRGEMELHLDNDENN